MSNGYSSVLQVLTYQTEQNKPGLRFDNTMTIVKSDSALHGVESHLFSITAIIQKGDDYKLYVTFELIHLSTVADSCLNESRCHANRR